MSQPPDRPDRPDRLVSTGTLPQRAVVDGLLREAYTRHADDRDGEVSTVYPALARAEPDRFGIAVAGVDGSVVEAGEARQPFALMSVAKPFVFALVAAERGADQVRRRIGVNATGLPFDSVEAVDRDPAGRTNPMVNAGAIATASWAPGDDRDAQWGFLAAGLGRFAGHRLELDDDVYASAVRTNHRNRAIAALLDSLGALGSPPASATEVYTRQSCLRVTAVDLAVMGATLADGGVNPVTGEEVVPAEIARDTLVTMTVAGMYESSGDWLLDVGLPGKSGIGGGIVTVSPGKGALGTFSPRLDGAGNSVRGQRVAAELARALGLDLFASRPAASST